MPKVLDEAHIVSIRDNRYMGEKVYQFRKWQKVSIDKVAKMLNKPAKTIHMLEDGELLNNKLLLQEAHVVGMGKQHILKLAGQTFPKGDRQERPLYHGTIQNDAKQSHNRESNSLYDIIHNLVNKNASIRSSDLCREVGKNPHYLSVPCKMSANTFISFAWKLGNPDTWIIKVLKKHDIPTMVFQQNLYGKVMRYCIRHSLSSAQFAHRANLTTSVIKRLRSGKSIRHNSKEQIMKALSGKNVKDSPSLIGLLKKHGYRSLSAFARKSNISLGTLSNINSGSDNPSRQTLQIISSKLNVPVSAVLSVLPKAIKDSNRQQNNRQIQNGYKYQMIKKRLDKLEARIVHQNDLSLKYKSQINNRIKALNQAIDYKKLGSWIDKSVTDDIRKEMPKYANQTSPYSLTAQKLAALYQQQPKARTIVDVLLHANPAQLNALYTIVKPWQRRK